MAERIDYKKPRKINAVTISLALVAMSIAYVCYQFFPMTLTKQEAYRVLEETSSVFAKRSSMYAEDPDAFKNLKNKMAANLRLAGVQDPAMEVWIEPGEGENFRFGVVYSAYFEWPFDVLEKKEYVTEVEHVLKRGDPTLSP